jgi:hypothetical protein
MIGLGTDVAEQKFIYGIARSFFMTRGEDSPKHDDEHQRGRVPAAHASDVSAQKRDEQFNSRQDAPIEQHRSSRRPPHPQRKQNSR